METCKSVTCDICAILCPGTFGYRNFPVPGNMQCCDKPADNVLQKVTCDLIPTRIICYRNKFASSLLL